MICNPLLEAHRELLRLAAIFHRPIVNLSTQRAVSPARDRPVDSLFEGAR